MRKSLLGIVFVLPLAVAGCGDAGRGGVGEVRNAAPTAGPSCAAPGSAGELRVRADLDGDGAPDVVRYREPGGRTGCPPGLATHVGGEEYFAPVTGGLPVASAGVARVRLPGRRGDLLLVEQAHPRGGFLAQLFGYAHGRFEALTVTGRPIFDFVATDVPTIPTTVDCIAGGFSVTRARAHQPVGVLPAWDVYRTTYVVDGNTVTVGTTTEVADDVPDGRLRQHPSDPARHPFFETCRANG